MGALFQNVLTASFHGSIIIAAVLLLRLALKKAPRKFICILWLLAGLRLLMPFEIQSQLSLQPEPEIVTQIQSQRPDLDALPEAERPEAAVVVTPQNQEAVTDQTAAAPEVQTQTAPVVTEPMFTQSVDPVTEPITVDILAMLPWLWLAVACGFGVYTVVSYLRLKLLVRDAVKIPGGWESDKIETAIILGFVRPKIYIPMGMSKSVRRHILAHERTHLEKGDHWFKMVGFVALAIHWFNPLVWVAYVCLCKDIETACDERVVQFMELEERKSYAAALLSCSTNHVHYGACPVAFGEVSVKERIKSVLHYRKPSFWISLLAVVAVLFVAVCLLTNQVETTEALVDFEDLTDEELVELCEDALDELETQDSFSMRQTFTTVRKFAFTENETTISEFEIYRNGEDYLRLYYQDGTLGDGSVLRYEGKKAKFDGAGWYENDLSTDSFGIGKDFYSTEGKTVKSVNSYEEEGSVYVDIQVEWGDLFRRTVTFQLDQYGQLLGCGIYQAHLAGGAALEEADFLEKAAETTGWMELTEKTAGEIDSTIQTYAGQMKTA